MPKIPESWKLRRARKLRHVQYNALQKIGLSTAGSPVSGETALCIAYMCPYAYTCPKAAFRPALVSQRDCYLRFPEEMRPRPGLSEHAIDTLADQRRAGQRLNPATLAVLDQFRPDGPSPSFGMKRPPRPVYANAPAQPPRPRVVAQVGTAVARQPGVLTPRVFVASQAKDRLNLRRKRLRSVQEQPS